MGYVIAAILVLLIVAGFVTFVVMNSMRKGSSRSSQRGGPPGIGPDETPLGDTAEHAGSQTESGHTADDPEDAARGFDPAQGQAAGEPARDTRPDSERLANRPR
jgi:hypothetical protein